MSVRAFNGLSLQFNAAVMTLANKLIPAGFQPKEEVSDWSRQQYVDAYRRNRGMIYVDMEPVPNSPFDDIEHDYAFKALCNLFLITRDECEHTAEGLYVWLRDQLIRQYNGPDKNALTWLSYLRAMTVGVHEHTQVYGHVPVKLKDFVESYVFWGTRALYVEW